MCTLNLGEIDAVAFDIDGTLYRNSDFYLKVFPHYLANLHFFRKYNEVRKELRTKEENTLGYKDLFAVQNELLAQKLSCSLEEARAQLDKIVYTGLKSYFQRIKVCRHAPELIQKLKDAGKKIALLSDFPPEQKGEIWGIKKNCDVILGTEEIGALKPSVKPFTVLTEKLGVPAQRILYIGNSHAYDVETPVSIGMKAAWFIPEIRGRLGCRSKIADITFWDYSQLEKILFTTGSD